MSHMDRVVIERDELFDRIHKLSVFIGGDVYRLQLTTTEQTLLRTKLDAMKIYHNILNLRLAR